MVYSSDSSSADKMDVDDEDNHAHDDNDDDDDEVLTQPEDDEDNEGDGEDAGARPKKKRHQRRKSEIDLAALNDANGALAQLDNAKIAQLKLLKKMHAEAMYFIRQIEGAMDMMGDLLGSKSKPEVLEAIEFFRVAHEYRFTQAEVWPMLSRSIID
jgi:condensin complex subunit 1